MNTNGKSNGQQPQVVAIPETVTLPGTVAVAIGDYIQRNPCPNFPVSVAFSYISALETALQTAAGVGAGAAPKPTGDAGIKAEAAKVARERLAKLEQEKAVLEKVAKGDVA